MVANGAGTGCWEAQTYADHVIAVHLREIGGGLTCSQLSARAMAAPANTKLAGQVATVFTGTTLRGILLNAHGFWQLGQIARIGAIVSFAGAALLLILSLLSPPALAGGDSDFPGRTRRITRILGTKVPRPDDRHPCRVRTVTGDSKGTWFIARGIMPNDITGASHACLSPPSRGDPGD
ncbi:MAG TPA: hypothetical protein VMU94_05415 [Streptosporangiaceae bacterium]|nr:hypothetical protein [Streptosporangiaceae bacterium]